MTCITQGDAAAVQIYLHNVVSVGHKAYILRPFLSLTFVFSSAFYGVYRLSLNISHWTDVAAGFAVGVLLAVYLVSSHDEYLEFTITPGLPLTTAVVHRVTETRPSADGANFVKS